MEADVVSIVNTRSDMARRSWRYNKYPKSIEPDNRFQHYEGFYHRQEIRIGAKKCIPPHGPSARSFYCRTAETLTDTASPAMILLPAVYGGVSCSRSKARFW